MALVENGFFAGKKLYHLLFSIAFLYLPSSKTSKASKCTQRG
jgi:hypothetical protein